VSFQIPKGLKVYSKCWLYNTLDPEGVAQKWNGNLFYKPVTLSGSRWDSDNQRARFWGDWN